MAEEDKKPPPPKKRLPPNAPGDPSMDLIPPSMLPERSVIPEWQRSGYGAEPYKPKPKVKKRGGGSISSASRRADGIAVKGKTRGKFV